MAKPVKVKGIIYAGKSRDFFAPGCDACGTYLFPVYDKPMIYYPLYTLMQADIRDVLIIVNRGDKKAFKRLLRTPFDVAPFLGVKISYVEVSPLEGVIKTLASCEKFLGSSPCVLILGDNIFYGTAMEDLLKNACEDAHNGYASIFAYKTNDSDKIFPVETDTFKRVTGLFVFPKGVSDLAKTYEIGQLEGLIDFLDKDVAAIASLLEEYNSKDLLKRNLLGYDHTWFNIDTYDDMLEAANFISFIQKNKKDVVCAPEILAIKKRWISPSVVQMYTRRINHAYSGKLIQKAIIRDEEDEEE